MPFPHSYEVDAEAELPPGTGGYHRYYYPGAKSHGGHADLLILIKPDSAEPWYGLFEGLGPNRRLAKGVFSCPHPSFVCVVVLGKGYMVRVDEPTDWARVPLMPIVEVVPVVEEGLLLMSSYNEVIAYGSAGELWRSTPRNVTDDLVIDRVTKGRLNVHGFNYALGKVEAVLDLATGKDA